MPQFDYIIVGAGSAGCVLANRLSANPVLSVLLIEAGPSDKSLLVTMPKGFGKLLTDTKHVRHFKTEADAGNNYKSEYWPKGKTLGGSSSVNGTLYNRGQPGDFDDWERLGAKGWGWQTMARHFRAIEDHALGDDGVRGAGGDMHISPHPDRHPLTEATIQAGLALGLERKDDLNRPNPEGIGYVTRTIQNGRRVSAATAFLDPARNRPNLTVWQNTLVTRLELKNNKATGIQCEKNGETLNVKARQEVILCAGSLQSPQLLQLAGIGPGEHLRSLNIPVHKDLPGVGRNLREHRMMFVQHALKTPLSYNFEFSGLRVLKHVLHYLVSKKGLMATSSHEVCAFVKSSKEIERPDLQLVMAPFSFDLTNEDEMVFEKSHGMQIFGYHLRPTSQGSVMIQSTDPKEQPLIRSNYLDTEEDRRASVAILRIIRSLYAQKPLQEFAAEETAPGRTVQDPEQILDYHRRHGQCVYHVAGTCKMGQDDLAVVDENLKVHGIEQLRVVDCSVMPTLVSGTTNASVMAIANRAAELILERTN